MQRDVPVERANPPVDPSLYGEDGRHDRMSKLCKQQVNISLRECSLPPEDLPPKVNEVLRRKSRKKDTSSRHSKDGNRKTKKKSSKTKKGNREKKSTRPDYDLYQELPTEPNSSKEKASRSKHRAIPESLTGREVSWSRSHDEDPDVIPFHEDLLKTPKKSRRHRRQRSRGETPISQVRLDAVEEHQRTDERKAIILDADGFPIEQDEDSVHSLDRQPARALLHIVDDSVPSTDKSHGGCNLSDSWLTQDSCASTEKSRMESLHPDSVASTERTPLSSNPVDSPATGGLRKFFQQQGRAINTAAAFEAFLREQHELTSDKDDSDYSSYSWTLRYKEDDKDEKDSSGDDSDDPFSHSKFWGSQSTLLPCDDDDVKSFLEEAPSSDEPFGRIRRNEAFIKRVSSKDLIKSTSERTLRSSVFDTNSTSKTDLTMSTLATKESSPRKGLRKSLVTANHSPVHPLASTRSLDAIIPHERTVERQLASLSLSQRSCVNKLKAKWEKQSDAKHFLPDEWYLRFARCSPGVPFNYKTAWKVMKRFDWRYFELSMSQMEATVLTKASFPVPGLKTKGGRDVFYMRPSRYFPRKAPTDNMIDLVVYVMNCMLEKEHGSAHGLGIVANMAGWTVDNFKVSYWQKLLLTLQGHRVPTRISAFLIVDPPSWFGSIWTIMKPMMSDDFREKVAVVSSEELGNYLMDGYRDHLPDDMEGGKLSTKALVAAFIAERKATESPGHPRKQMG